MEQIQHCRIFIVTIAKTIVKLFVVKKFSQSLSIDPICCGTEKYPLNKLKLVCFVKNDTLFPKIAPNLDRHNYDRSFLSE